MRLETKMHGRGDHRNRTACNLNQGRLVDRMALSFCPARTKPMRSVAQASSSAAIVCATRRCRVDQRTRGE